MTEFVFGAGLSLPARPEAREAAALTYNRELPDNSGGGDEEGGTSALNLFFIVGMALVITVLARYLANRGRRGR